MCTQMQVRYWLERLTQDNENSKALPMAHTSRDNEHGKALLIAHTSRDNEHGKALPSMHMTNNLSIEGNLFL